MHIEEDLYSPKVSIGESPSFEILLHVFPDPGQLLRSAQAYQYAMEWIAKNPDKIETVTQFQRLTKVDVSAVSGSDGSSFDVTLTYSKWKTKTTIFSMDTGGETAKRYYGVTRSCAGKADGSNTPPNFYGGINFHNGEFQGIDIPVPGAKFTIQACFPWSFINAEYMQILTLYRGSTNSQTFLYFQPGEVMFLGSQIQMEEEINPKGKRQFFWRITFNFQASPNVSGLTNNGTLLPIDKGGWDAYWVYCVSAPDPAAQRVIQRPIAHYSVQVAPSADFAALSIPDFRLQVQG